MNNKYPNTLRARRKLAGMHQHDVASFLGLESTDRISHWEKGSATPHLINLLKLSFLYQVPVHELYGKLYRSISEKPDQSSEEESPAASVPSGL